MTQAGGGSGGSKRAVAGQAACPVCGKPAEAAHRPFCSDRCRKVDLNRWLSETYRVPARPVDDEEQGPGGGDEPAR